MGAAAGSGVGAAALIILAVIMFIVKRSNFTLTKGKCMMFCVLLYTRYYRG